MQTDWSERHLWLRRLAEAAGAEVGRRGFDRYNLDQVRFPLERAVVEGIRSGTREAWIPAPPFPGGSHAVGVRAIVGDERAWWTFAGLLDLEGGGAAAISSLPERRTISGVIGGPRLDGFGDQVRPYAIPAPPAGRASTDGDPGRRFWDLLTGRAPAAVTAFVAVPLRRLEFGLGGDNLDALFPRAFGLRVFDGTGGFDPEGSTARLSDSFRRFAVAFGEAELLRAAAQDQMVPRLDAPPGTPCPGEGCGAPLADPDAGVPMGGPMSGDFDWVRSSPVRLVCPRCGRGFVAEKLERVLSTADGKVTYERKI